MTDGSASGDVARGGDSASPGDGAVQTLRTPTPEAVARTRAARFRARLAAEREVELADHAASWQWSVDELAEFWAAEFRRVVEAFDEVLDSLVIDTSGAGRTDGELLCFLVLAPGAELADVEPELRSALREQLSPRHVPNTFILIDAVPRTPNGKKCEVPVKKILSGVPVDRAISAAALRDPKSLLPFVEIGRAHV